MVEMSPAPVAGSRRPRLRWHVIYYLLAAFDILIVTGSLVLNAWVMDKYVHAVASNQEWGQLLADFAALEELVGEIDATGNDVFESHDAARELRRLQATQAAFRERLAALRKDLLDMVPTAQAPPLLLGLVEIDRRTETMASAAGEVLTLFAAGEREAAGRSMAAMDRQYAALLGLLRDMRGRFALARAPRPVATPSPEPGTPSLNEGRWQRFERHTSAAASMQRWEFVLALLIVAMVMAAVVYGRHIARHMEREDKERARHIDELREAREGLEQRVLERTEALRRSEDELRRAAAEWHETFEAIESPVLLLDARARVVRANHAATSLAGADRELAGRPVEQLAAGEPWGTIARLVSGLPEAGSASLQVRDRGTQRTWDISINRLAPAESGGRAIAVARDVTRTVELQETVAREEKLAAMGRLVAGVAHEVRNPLFGISGTLDAFQLRQAQGEPFEKYLPSLRRDIARLQALMRDLLEYGKPARLALAPTPLEEVVGEAVRACRQATGDVGVEVAVPKDLPRVLVDRPRLVQVFQNLVQNAIEHTPAGGRVTVEAGVRPDPTPGRAVWCTVRDTGSGFREEDLPRLFEPFFTHRPGGTGLGLSIAQRIVQQHGGAITADNDPRGGAVVTVVIRVLAE